MISAPRLRLAAAAMAAALAVSLSACSADEVFGSGDPETVLPADSSGLLLINCWSDTATVLDATTGQPGQMYATYRDPVDSEVTVANLCQNYPAPNLSGVSQWSPDHTLIAATKRSADGAVHAGYVAAATGEFTDVSERLKLDANGRYTDQGSGLDDFAGPIKDQTIGFAAGGAFLLQRADVLHSAVSPDFVEFVKQPNGVIIGDTAIGGITEVSAGSYRAALLQLPAGTDQIEPAGGSEYADPAAATFGPLVFPDSDDVAAAADCDQVRWIDDLHLLCQGLGEDVWVMDLSDAELHRADELTESDSGDECSDCRGWQYVWSIPSGAVKPLVPETSRELTGFTPVSSRGEVYFLADNGDTLILYSVSTAPGATPTKLSTFAVADSPSFTFLSLQWR